MATILVIDDETQVRSLLRQALTGAGYEVIEAGNGREGLERYREAPADLVITDILMPDEDGLEATLELTRQFPNVKIIAITGGSGERNFLDVAKLFGARRTLAKPFGLDRLLEAVQEELKA
ncbi:MAG: response regulator [Nitrospirales bacterium]|jgi:two-component system response regulator (stage 0 sporulation protein F)